MSFIKFNLLIMIVFVFNGFTLEKDGWRPDIAWSILRIPAGAEKAYRFEELPFNAKYLISDFTKDVFLNASNPIYNNAEVFIKDAISSNDDDVVILRWNFDSLYLEMVTARSVTNINIKPFNKVAILNPDWVINKSKIIFNWDNFKENGRKYLNKSYWPAPINTGDCFFIGDSIDICFIKSWENRIDVCLSDSMISYLFFTKLSSRPCFESGNKWFEEAKNRSESPIERITKYSSHQILHIEDELPVRIHGDESRGMLFRYTKMVAAKIKGEFKEVPDTNSYIIDFKITIDSLGNCSEFELLSECDNISALCKLIQSTFAKTKFAAKEYPIKPVTFTQKWKIQKRIETDNKGRFIVPQ